MKYVLLLAVFGFILWMYLSTLKDIYGSYKRRKLNSQMKALEVEARSDEVREIRRVARKKKLEPFTDLINAASLDTIVELDMSDFSSPLIEKFAKANEGNVKAHFMYGNFLIDKAWEARSGAVASNVSEKQITGFYDYLNQAEQELQKVKELDSSFTAVYCSLLKVALGQSEKQKAYKLFDEAFQLAPEQLDYHTNMLVLLTEKWLGSEQEMFEFARKHASRESSGALKGLIPAAHFEAQLFLDAKETEAYFAQADVQKEIREAYAGIENSVPGSSFDEKHSYYLALNFFVVIFQYMDDNKTAVEIYEKIGGHRKGSPWGNIGKDTREAFMNFKKMAYEGK